VVTVWRPTPPATNRVYMMKEFTVQITKQQTAFYKIEAKNQPEAIQRAYHDEHELIQITQPEVIKIKAKQRFN
jgi:hypothetical protein